MDTLAAEVWQTLQALNRAWAVEGDTDALAGYFHEEMVAVTPAQRGPLQGREACIAGWKGFVDAATIHSWHETEPDVRVFCGGQFAVVTYFYDMSVTMGGRTFPLAGRDMMALVKEGGRWWVVADQFSPFPEE